VLGCVAQQEGEKILRRRRYVSMVAGSASYRNLPAMLVQIEAGNKRVTGLDDRETDLTFETEFTARSNAHRGYITIIEGCDSSAPIVWCRIRGVRTQPDVRFRPGGSAPDGRPGLYRHPIAGAKR